MKNNMEVPQKIKNRNTILSSNPFFGYIAEGNEITVLKRYRHIHCSVLHNSQDMETIEVSTVRWMDEGYGPALKERNLIILWQYG